MGHSDSPFLCGQHGRPYLQPFPEVKKTIKKTNKVEAKKTGPPMFSGHGYLVSLVLYLVGLDVYIVINWIETKQKK